MPAPVEGVALWAMVAWPVVHGSPGGATPYITGVGAWPGICGSVLCVYMLLFNIS